MKPKTNSAGDPAISNTYDRCQTPPYALGPLLPYLKPEDHIWEPAAGEGEIVRTLRGYGYHVTATDLLTGQNFFKTPVPFGVKKIVTNPPYSIKYPWSDYCYSLEIPFALLIPLESLGAAVLQALIQRHGAEIIFMDKRVDFKMPGHTWQESSAQFPVIWLTWGLGIGQQMTFAKLHKPGKQRKAEMDMGIVQAELFGTTERG